MFSMTPLTVMLTFAAIAADSAATFWAAGCGVVTTYTSARGRYWLRLRAMSPVPGGMSMSRKSGSSQNTSVRNCSSALCSIGPRQIDGLALGHEVADRDAAHAVALGRHQHLVDDDRIAIGAEHARDREAVDVGVDDADRVALLGQRDGEVDGDAGLADAALARRDQQRPGLRAGLGERHLATLGVPVRLALAGGVAGVAVHHHPHGLALLVGHHREVEGDPLHTGQRGQGRGHPAGDLVAQRAAGNGERDQHIDDAVVVERRLADHAEVDDRAPQLGILHGPQGLDDLLSRGCRHGGLSGKRVAANYHYADR